MYKFLKNVGCFLSGCLISQSIHAQNAQPSQLFELYKQDKSKSVLPDFSYVGYHCGEKPVPEITNYKVFNVVDFGARPNDDVSDKKAIQAAINAANSNGSGIVFFPKGRFLVNDDSTLTKGIVSKGSRIIFRGSGSGPGGTELFMKAMMVPQDPKRMWTGRPMFTFTAKGTDTQIGQIAKNANVGDFDLKLSTTDHLQAGDWIAIKLLDNAPELVSAALAPGKANPAWKYIIEQGVDVCMYYQVKAISNGYITLHAPLAYPIDIKYKWSVYKFANAEEVGIENIAFAGNWKQKFVHHRSWKDDSGFNLLSFSHCTNSWMKNCRFTDCNIAAMVSQSANVTVMDCVITGNGGHEAIGSNHSTNVLLANLKDEASQWHAFGVQHGSVNTVLWHCSYPSTTCFEAHASQPINSLFDNTTGGFMSGRQGGAVENLPNHMGGLVLWNYTQTNNPVKDFDFAPSNDVWFKMVNPIVVGFTSKGSSFKKGQPGYFESIGQKVSPASLYEAQLELRLKKVPDWLKQH
ncbi:pectate lyase-like protein [Mucilaginibacter yixingensis]|uniref:Pectate lyase-like protein n=1 Tax=Mucilaginibacter yixingensis TaxID=1295612 RepID=A0A2T5J5Y3_9SPHI|nr:DUF4955 domain-containing protein [Mucilaginibacter yixingensis]PTQ93960.1 pectate lyase-like protein [Mucilaginibacter yixingensis]